MQLFVVRTRDGKPATAVYVDNSGTTINDVKALIQELRLDKDAVKFLIGDASESRSKACIPARESHPIAITKRQHPRFYFPDGNVIFRVENTLYKIHRYFFQRDSPVFEAMFALPTPVGESPEGEVEDRPIQLEGIECRDFDRLLSLMYPKDFTICEITTFAEWKSILFLSTYWDLTSLRELSIQHLAPLASSADLVALGHQYDVPQWLLPEYLDLCVRDEPLSLEEGNTLGLEIVIMVNQIRHKIRYKANLNRHRDDIVELVRSVFS